MDKNFRIRIAKLSDTSELKDLFQNTVLNVNKRDYSLAEVEDWASCGNDLSHIEEMIKTHYFIVAIKRDRAICYHEWYHTNYIRNKFNRPSIL